MIRIRLMTAADVALGMRLTRQNGWNQLEADWRRVLALQPDGCFVAEWNGEPVATTVACIFGNVASVMMVLVEASQRGHGIGTALMKHALDFLDNRRVPSVRLDATPMGRPIYEKLGFVAEYELARYEGTLGPAVATLGKPGQVGVTTVNKRSDGDVDELLQFDRAVTHCDRGGFLARLIEEYPEHVRIARSDGVFQGYFAARPGSRATLLGPCLASEAAGPALLVDAAQRYVGQPVFIDVPLANEVALELVKSWGLKFQRGLLRMGRGKPVRDRVDALWTSSGPEKG